MLYRCNYCHIGWESDDTEIPKLCDHCHVGTPEPAADEPEREPPRSQPVFPKSDFPMPNVIGDKLPKHHDWSLGEDISSKSERRRKYAENGMVVRSFAERQRRAGRGGKHGVAYSFAGQKDRRSSSERRMFEGDL